MNHYQDFNEIKIDIANGNTSVHQLVVHYLKKIEEQKYLNAFLEVFEEEALTKAQELDQKIKEGNAGRLAGMVIGIKDNICYQGHQISAASKILTPFESLFSATAIERLIAEDAIIIGRLNCDEFAMGSSNENSSKGNVLNPVNIEKVPGGSSGGSAAAVKAGLCLATLGSDTGGSIRQPASFCGIVGLKPTYGRISRHGLIAYASSFDQIGPLTNSVEDAALLTEIMSGADDYDSTASQKPVADYGNVSKETGKKKIVYLKDSIEREGIDEEVKTRIYALVEQLKEEGHEVVPVDFPYLDYVVPTYHVLTTAEASSNLERYDGIHYGYRNQMAKGIEEVYVSSRTEGFGEEVKRRIMLGTFVLSAGYYDAYFTKAQRVRRLLQSKTREILKDADFILTPTTPTTAFGIGENVDDPITMYLQDIYTVQANLTGNPAISLPLGEHSNGLPFGIQLIAKDFEEKEMLNFSAYLIEINRF